MTGKYNVLKCHGSNTGFTLVELLVAMGVGGIIMAAVMTSFQSQHRVYLAQDEVVEMQQNGRVALDLLVRDLHSAGYNPNDLIGVTGITEATSQTVGFTRDNGAGAVETIRYALVDAFTTEGRNDGLVDDLGRNEGGGLQPVAENISNLEFRYLDSDGQNMPAPVANLDKIRSVQLTFMVQVSHPDPSGSVPSRTYTTPGGTNWNSTAGFRSSLFTTTIQCRNLGL